MSVFKKKNRNLWACKYTENGKQKTRYFKSEQEAASFEQELNEPEQTRLTVGELVAAYIRSTSLCTNTKNVIVWFLTGREHGGKHVEGAGEFLFGKYADVLSRIDLERMRENLRLRGCGNNTLNHYQAQIRAALAWGVDQQLISSNPWRDFKRLPVKRPMITTTMKDVQAVYRKAEPWLQWSIKTAFCLSLRPGKTELFSLLWSAFVWRRGCVVVRQGKSGRLKTVFPPQWYMDEAKIRYVTDSENGIQIVCHRRGKAVNSYRGAWNAAIKKAGVLPFRPYDIRHVAASEMLAAGADLASVSAQLGHSSVITTGTFYAHVTSGGQQQAASLMPSLDTKKVK